MSGSHSPFSVHVAELDPMSTNPGEQLSLTVLPSMSRLLSPSIIPLGTKFIPEFMVGSLQAPAIMCIKDNVYENYIAIIIIMT